MEIQMKLEVRRSLVEPVWRRVFNSVCYGGAIALVGIVSCQKGFVSPSAACEGYAYEVAFKVVIRPLS